VTTTAYTLATVEDRNGARHPAEYLWTPTPDDAVKNGFINHNGLIVTGVGEENEPPSRFVVLGHGHTWTAIWDGAAAFMQSTWGWIDLYSYPHEEPPATASRTLPPIEQHAVFIRHPHPDRPCGCEWDDTWRMVDVEAGEPGAVPVTVIRHPAAVNA
jgi:hypothetical protein